MYCMLCVSCNKIYILYNNYIRYIRYFYNSSWQTEKKEPQPGPGCGSFSPAATSKLCSSQELVYTCSIYNIIYGTCHK